MNIKSRICKLEAAMITQAEPLRISYFSVEPGHLNPPGYTCDGITIMRETGETTDALQKRCTAAVDWPDVAGFHHVFYPLV
ncbi:MAG: hypothetical protein WAW61_15065 [Methylococcaceae bacterium]